ncbi:MAG: AEC family transporter [Legionellales bacterium]
MEHLFTILPLLIMVIIGFLAQRFYQVQSKSLASLAIYILSPAVMLLGVLDEHLNLSILYMPLIVLLIGIIISAVFYPLAGLIWSDARKQMVGFSAGTANTSYFGIPVCAAILGVESVPIAIMFALGQTLFEATVGYYLAARGQADAKQSILKLIKLPMLYALLLALILRSQYWELPAVAADSVELLASAFTPIGMMLIGVGLAESKLLVRPDIKFMSMVLFIKFAVWLGMVLGFVWLDQNIFHLFNPLAHQVMLIQAVAPVAVSTVAYAAEFKLFPEKMSMTVVVSLAIVIPILSLVLAYF